MPQTKKDGIPLYVKPGVYVTLNLVNGKVYIGSTTSIRRRTAAHRKALRRGKHENGHLQGAWDKYGEAAFQFNVVQRCEPDELIELEQYYIDSMDATNPLKGYNLCPIANMAMLGRKHTPESRAKMSEHYNGKGRPLATKMAAEANRGKKRPAEVRAKISAGNKGVPKSPEHRAATKATHWSKRPDAAEIAAKSADKNRGKKHTDEHKQNISAGNLRRWEKLREAKRLESTGNGPGATLFD